MLVFNVVLAMLSGLPEVLRAQQASSNRPVPSVVIETVVEQSTEAPGTYIGRVEALEAVDLRARVPGFLDEVGFKPGALVKAGDVLFVVEPARYEAAVAAARAQVERAVAVRLQATISRDRNAALVSGNATARAALDDAQASYDVANADLAAAEASLAKAELDFSYTRIVAPISGRISQPFFTRGNLVGSDNQPLARLVQVDPVRVAFSVSEGEVATFRQSELSGGATSGAAFSVTLRLPNDTSYDQAGTLEFLGPEVDPRTGTVAVRTIFPNPDGLLLPGQFVNLVVGSVEGSSGPVIAQSAIMQDRDGRFVYVLLPGNTVQIRRVETGAKIGERWAVTKGLDTGEKVVVQGTQRLADGMAVQPIESAVGSL